MEEKGFSSYSLLHHDSSGSNSDLNSQQSATSSKKRTIDEFEFLKEIGQGAFGTVYLGRDKMTDKTVAIKSVNQ